MLELKVVCEESGENDVHEEREIRHLEYSVIGMIMVLIFILMRALCSVVRDACAR